MEAALADLGYEQSNPIPTQMSQAGREPLHFVLRLRQGLQASAVLCLFNLGSESPSPVGG